MDQRAKVIIGALVLVIAIMTVGLVVAASNGSGNNTMGDMAGMAMNMNDPNVRMMEAMGSMNSDVMLTHMREVLGEEGYRRMLEHWGNHRAGGPMTGNPAVDEMMHQMMDSMMQRMPADRDRVLPLPSATPAR